MGERVPLLRDKEDVGEGRRSGGQSAGRDNDGVAPPVVGCRGTKRDLWNLVSRMCTKAGRSSRRTSGRGEADGFTDPEPRTGQEADDGRDGMRPEGALGGQLLGRLDQGGDLCGVARGRAVGRRKDATRPLSGTSVSGRLARRYVRKPRAILKRWAAPPVPRRVAAAQAQSMAQLGPNGTSVPPGLEEAHKVAQQRARRAHLKSEGLPAR